MNGALVDLNNAPIGVSDKTYPTFPLTVHIEVNEDGTGTYEDSEGNSGALPPSAVAFTGKTCQFAMTMEAPDTASSTVLATTNASGPLAD